MKARMNNSPWPEMFLDAIKNINKCSKGEIKRKKKKRGRSACPTNKRY